LQKKFGTKLSSRDSIYFIWQFVRKIINILNVINVSICIRIPEHNIHLKIESNHIHSYRSSKFLLKWDGHECILSYIIILHHLNSGVFIGIRMCYYAISKDKIRYSWNVNVSCVKKHESCIDNKFKVKYLKWIYMYQQRFYIKSASIHVLEKQHKVKSMSK
jgi:hypothetical protein